MRRARKARAVEPVIGRERKRRTLGRVTPEYDEFFEDVARRELARLPAKHWPNFLALWHDLGAVDPSTAKRIVAHGLRLCAERGEAPPMKLVAEIERFLVAGPSRNRGRLEDQQREAAFYLARHPNASSREIARAVGTSHQTIEQWRRRARKFRLFLNDETARIPLGHRPSQKRGKQKSVGLPATAQA
jgi:hypothetical protein